MKGLSLCLHELKSGKTAYSCPHYEAMKNTYPNSINVPKHF
ncbi:unnamed protein product [Brassica rapa subsp. trilocularis]